MRSRRSAWLEPRTSRTRRSTRRSPARRRARPGRKTSEEIAAASKDPALVRVRAAPRLRTRGHHRTRAGRRRRRDRELVRDPQAPRDATALRRAAGEATARCRRWAVPKGLPTVKGDKRLAVRTEDHPLEYGSFEGTIPEGHYGAGEVRIFDDGWYEPVEWTDSKVSFILHGRRYPGLEFHFVKTSTDWLAFLASAQIGAAGPGARRGSSRCWPRADGRRSTTTGGGSNPSSTGSGASPSSRPARPSCGPARGRDVTAQYPELHMVHELVDQVNAVVDGEIVAFDEGGRNSFEALQQRMNLQGQRAIARASKTDPGRPGRLRPAVARRTRHHGPRRWSSGASCSSWSWRRTTRLQVMAHVQGDGKAFTESARGARARRGGGQADGLDLPAGPSHHPTGARSSSSTPRTA